MQTILPLMVAVLAGNLLTVLFLWGAWNLRHVKDDRDARPLALFAMGFPMFFAAVGFYVFG